MTCDPTVTKIGMVRSQTSNTVLMIFLTNLRLADILSVYLYQFIFVDKFPTMAMV